MINLLEVVKVKCMWLQDPEACKRYIKQTGIGPALTEFLIQERAKQCICRDGVYVDGCPVCQP